MCQPVPGGVGPPDTARAFGDKALAGACQCVSFFPLPKKENVRGGGRGGPFYLAHLTQAARRIRGADYASTVAQAAGGRDPSHPDQCRHVRIQA